MVDRGSLQAFFDEEDGVTLVEALLVTPIVILAITVMVELGVAMFQWNQSVKAIQIGARAASVSEPLMTWETYEAAMMSDWSGTNEGDPTPVAAITISCGAGSSPCDSDGMDSLLTGGDGACGEGGLPIGMCDVAPWIRAENVLITYSRSGLGYVGRPCGPVSTVTVELSDVEVELLFLDRVLELFIPDRSPFEKITIPRHRVSATSEDLSNSNKSC